MKEEEGSSIYNLLDRRGGGGWGVGGGGKEGIIDQIDHTKIISFEYKYSILFHHFVFCSEKGEERDRGIGEGD